MNKNKAAILIALTVVLLAFAGCQASPAGATDQNTQQYAAAATQGSVIVDLAGNQVLANKLTVSGTAKISVMPDVAYVTAGVTTQNKDAKKAQSDNKDTMNSLYSALEAAGITKDDIKTTNYSVYPLYDYNNGKSTIYAYQVTNTIRITVRNIENAGDIIDIAAANGANSEYSVTFDLLDEGSYYRDALDKAIKDARTKADTMAAAGSFSITGVLEVSEGSTSYYPQYRAYAAAMDESASTPISAGQLEVSANVTIIYRID